MKFAAKTTDTGHIESFTRIVSMITKLAKQCALHVSATRLIFSRPAALRSDSGKLYCEINAGNYFEEFRMEGWSAEQNEIYIEIMPDELHQALRSAQRASSMKVKLTKKGNAPYLTIEVQLSAISAAGRIVTHDVPINVIPPRSWSEFAEPTLPEFDVSLYLPPLKTVQKVVAAMKSIAHYLTISANKGGGDMTFHIRTEPAELTTHFKDLFYAEWKEEESTQGSQRSQLSGRSAIERPSTSGGVRPRDADTDEKMYSARVDLKTLAQFLASQQAMHHRLIISVLNNRLVHFCAVSDEIRFQYFVASVDE